MIILKICGMGMNFKSLGKMLMIKILCAMNVKDVFNLRMQIGIMNCLLYKLISNSHQNGKNNLKL